MISLALSILASATIFAGEIFKEKRFERFARPGVFAFLLLWLWQTADLANLGEDEERLLLWFAWGALLLLVGEVIYSIQQRPSALSAAPRPLAALFFAFGLDFLRPDSYALVPAGIVGLMVLAVALKTLRRFWPFLVKWEARIRGALIAASYALLLYSAIYKLFDRGWVLPWSLLLAAGTFLLVLSQLWHWWSMLKIGHPTADRFAQSSYDVANIVIVFSAYFHYQQFY